MSAAAYIVISATGNIADGKKLIVMDWHPSKPAGASGIGVGGDGWLSRGEASQKWTWDFTARFQKVGDIGYASRADVELWSTAAAGMLLMTDVDGDTRTVQWLSTYAWDAYAGESYGDTEWYKITVKLRQK